MRKIANTPAARRALAAAIVARLTVKAPAVSLDKAYVPVGGHFVTEAEARSRRAKKAAATRRAKALANA